MSHAFKEALNKSLLARRWLCGMGCAKGDDAGALSEDLFSASLSLRPKPLGFPIIERIRRHRLPDKKALRHVTSPGG